VSDESTSFIR